jgi:hypothetical protein
VLVRVAYTDAYKHPFEAVHVATIAVATATEVQPAVAVRLKGAALDQAAQVNAQITALDKAMRVHATFFAPSTVSLVPHTADLVVEPSAPATLPAAVEKAGATPGSRLPVFSIAEYDTAAGHDTVFAAAVITVQGAIPGAASTFSLDSIILIVVAMLVVTWAVLALPPLLRRRSRHAQ